MTPDSPTLTATEAIAPVLAEASALGLDFRPISGLAVKRARRLGIDFDELGKASDSSLSDDEYHEQAMRACWLLCAPEEDIAAAVAAGSAPSAAESWEARAVTTMDHMRACYRALMARWLEYRVELDRLFGEDGE